MNVRHVILRTTPAPTRDPFLGALSAPTVEESVAAGVSVEVDHIDTHTIPALSGSAEVLAIAPVIPRKLIFNLFAGTGILDKMADVHDALAAGVWARQAI